MGKITALSLGPKHHFFGYYGINPWDQSLRYHLALETDFHEHRPEAEEYANVGLIDAQTHEFMPYAKTSAFNLQQGSMMHWINTKFGEEFTYNSWDNDALISRAINQKTGDARTIKGAIAAVSPTQPVAIGLNFARMAHCRAVVGYANDIDPATLHDTPEDDGLSLIDLETGESRLILSIADVIKASNCKEVQGKRAWFNHVLFNTDGSRLLFFCRVNRDGLFTSLWTVNSDGSDLECQIPFRKWISHFAWGDPEHILISCNLFGNGGFLEFADRKRNFAPFGEGILPRDGHACFSPDGQWLVCDYRTSRNSERMAGLILYNVNDGSKIDLGEFRANEQFQGDIRCDLHPRWSHDGKTISFDSIHGNGRQIYLIDTSNL